jgi:penicillin-binding protein 2
MIDLNERHIEKKSFFNRLLLIYFFFGFLFFFLISKTYSLQISSYSDYELAALKNKTKEVLVQPVRGIIFDRNGNILVNNVPTYDLIIQPSKVKNLDDFIINISKIIELTEAEIESINKNFKNKATYNRELTIKKDLSKEEIAKFEVRSFRFQNAFIDVRYSRESKYPFLFSHALGYVGGASNDKVLSILKNQKLKQSETNFKYSGGFIAGKTGLENIYDSVLRGSFGKRIFEVDAKGRFLKELSFDKPINGKNIFTNLDLNAQKIAFEQMDNRRGAVVALELRSGSIVTYLSTPTFNVNGLSNGMSSLEFNKLINDVNKPFFDRAGQGRYSPASTIKPAIALFGIEEKIVDWNFTLKDPGYFILPEDQRVYRGWKKGGHGTIDMRSAIVESSNTFFFSLAYKSDINNLISHLSKFGFGRNVCKDCFNPDSGLLPTPEWKMNNLNFGWFKGDTVNLGVGQGYMSATPVQLAYYSAFIAKKGNLQELSFVKYDDTSETTFINNLSIDDLDWNKIHSSMIGVIEDPKGTAKRLKPLKSYVVAAKSGTVELVSTETKEDYKLVRQNIGNRDHAIIVAFGPMPNPEYAVSVVIENGESGGSVAGPVAIAVLNELINK